MAKTTPEPERMSVGIVLALALLVLLLALQARLYGAAVSVANADELRAALRAAQPGDTIVLADGIYPGQYDLAGSGEPGRPITLRAANVWRAVIDPSGGYGDGVDCGVRPHDLVLDGLRITGARTIGIRASDAERVTIRNCLVELCGNQGVFVYGRNCTVSRNLIRRNGTGRLHHGLYFSGRGHQVMDNVIESNAGWGIHGYTGKPETDVVECLLIGNVISGNDRVGLGLWKSERCFVAMNQAWGNGVNYDYHVPSETNRIAGNVEYDLGRWPLATRPE